MHCKACGNPVARGSRFCRHCGARIDEPVATKPIPEEAFDVSPSPPRIHESRQALEKALELSEKGDVEGAIEACKHSIACDPDYVAAHSLLGTLYERVGDKEKALAEYEIVLRLNPHSVIDRHSLKRLCQELGREEPKDESDIAHEEPEPSVSPFLRPLPLVGAVVFSILLIFLTRLSVQNSSTLDASQAVHSALPAGGGATDVPSASGTGAEWRAWGAMSAPTPEGEGRSEAEVTGSGRVGEFTFVMPPTTLPPLPAAGVGLGSPSPSSPPSSRQATSTSSVASPSKEALPPVAMPSEQPTISSPPATTSYVTPRPAEHGSPTSMPPTQPRITRQPQTNRLPTRSDPFAPSTTPAPPEPQAGASREAAPAPQMSIDDLEREATRKYIAGDIDGAIETYQEILRREPQAKREAMVRQQLANLYRSQKRYSAAAEQFQLAIDAYERQKQQGVDVEQAEQGISACERGLELCKMEMSRRKR